MSILTPSKLTKWQVLSIKDISPSKWMPIRLDSVKIKGDKVIDFYYIAMGPAVMVFPITKEGKFVLVRQYKHGIKDLVIEAPAGMVEKGQTSKQAAIHELEQETGILYDESKLIDIGIQAQSPTKNDHTLQGYLALDVEFNSVQKFDEVEDIEVLLVKPNDTIEMVKSGEIWASDTVAFLLKIKLLYPDLFK